MPRRWIPFLGDFEESDDGVVFKGKTLEFQKGDKVEKQPLVGYCISDQFFSGGAVRADITFTTASPLKTPGRVQSGGRGCWFVD